MVVDRVGLTLGAAFYGYTIGAALFGMTITQAYHYYLNTKYGPTWQYYIVTIILILDTLHFSFAMHMMYTYLLETLFGDGSVSSKVVWSLKSMGSVQVLFTVFVQALYLHKIWTFSKNPVLLSSRFRTVLRGIVVLLSLMAIGVGVVFLVELQRVKAISSFNLRFEYVIYLGFGATAFIDMGIAAAMCLMLHKGSAGTTKRANQIVTTLIQYIVGTGLLTSLGALLIMVLYIAWPDSLLYLGIEYSMTRLYAISVLSLYNSQSRLRDKMSETREFQGASMLYFAEPDKIISHGGGHGFMGPHSQNGLDDGDRDGPRRGDTLDSLASPDSTRPLTRMMFDQIDAEDTLVEARHPLNSPMMAHISRHRTGRHNTA